MNELLLNNPWLIVVGLGMLVPICGIVFGTVTSYLQQTHRAELEASLKHAMLERGMSAEDIKIVLEASAKRGAGKKQCYPASELTHSDKA
jgi:hypothetical protein